MTIDSNKEKVKLLSLFLKYILNSTKIFKKLELVEDKLDQYNKIMIEQNNKLETIMKRNNKILNAKGLKEEFPDEVVIIITIFHYIL